MAADPKQERRKRIQRWIGAPQTGMLNDPETLDELEKDLPGLAEHIARSEAVDATPAPAPIITRPRVALVVGHTPTAPGADTYLGEAEFYNRQNMARRVKDLLESMGINAQVFYRQAGVGYGAAMRKLGAEIDKFAPVLAVEMHFNAYDGEAHGFEFLYVSKRGKLIALEFAAQWSTTYPGAKPRRGPSGTGIIKASSSDHGYGFLVCCRAPACLLEPGFYDNPHEAPMFLADPDREAVANATAIKHAIEALSR